MERMESVGEMKNPDELEKKAATVLELSNTGLRKRFTDIAQEESPTQAFEKAFDLANEHFDAGIRPGIRQGDPIPRDHSQGLWSKSIGRSNGNQQLLSPQHIATGTQRRQE